MIDLFSLYRNLLYLEIYKINVIKIPSLSYYVLLFPTDLKMDLTEHFHLHLSISYFDF